MSVCHLNHITKLKIESLIKCHLVEDCVLITSPKMHNIGEHMQVVNWSHVCICPKFFLSLISLFFIGETSSKSKTRIYKFKKKKSDFGGFQSSKVRKKLEKIIRFLYLVFSM